MDGFGVTPILGTILFKKLGFSHFPASTYEAPFWEIPIAGDLGKKSLESHTHWESTLKYSMEPMRLDDTLHNRQSGHKLGVPRALMNITGMKIMKV